MPDPGQLQDALGSIFSNMFAEGSQKYLIYVGWFMWAVFIGVIGAFFYYMIRYKYKLTIFIGSIESKDGKQVINVRKVKRDRAMPVKEKGIAKWRLLFNFKKIEPIDYRYIMPGNHVFLFRTGPDTFNPIPKPTVSNPSNIFTIDPFDRAFLNLGVQSDAREYMKDTDIKRAQVWMFVSGLIILISIVVAGWLILKYSAGTAEKIEVAAQAANTLRDVAGGLVPH